MRINCLACGHKVELDDVYDNYEGQVKCWVCGALLQIKSEEGNLKSLEFVKMVPRPTLEEAFERSR